VKSLPSWTAELPAALFEDVHGQLMANVSAVKIAARLQDEDKVWPDLTAKAATQRLTKYKNEFVTPEQQKALQAYVKHNGTGIAKKRLDVVGSMEDMIVIHRDRLLTALAGERALLEGKDTQQFTLRMAVLGAININEELERHTIMLDRLAKLHLEIGLMVRVPKKVTGTLADMMGNQALFTFTEEDAARLAPEKLLDGVEYHEEK
jgi:hypothetical protein